MVVLFSITVITLKVSLGISVFHHHGQLFHYLWGVELKAKIVFLLTGILAATFSWSQTCSEASGASTPNSAFTTSNAGLVTHANTGLIWMRCSLGQSWNEKSKSCTGNPAMLDWTGAKEQADDFVYEGLSDWRLPSIKELATIVEKQCDQPSINLVSFPGTASDYYWSGFQYIHSDDFVWLLNFDSGHASVSNKKLQYFVRLVRN